MSIKALYHTSARATGGRDGRAAADDGRLAVNLSTPKELGGAGGEGTNPEQLFAAGYAACFLNAMKYIAGQQNSPFPSNAAVTATVAIGPREAGEGFGLDVALSVSLPGAELAAAEKLTQTAHSVCPYSNAIHGNVSVAFTISTD